MNTPSDLRLQSFLNRLPANAPPAVARNIETSLRLSDRFHEKATEIRGNDKLSAQGKREELVVVASKGFAAHHSQLRKEIDKAIAGIAGEIAGLRKRSLDSLGEFPTGLQRECRDYLRSLNESDRRRLVLETGDPLLLASILNAPAFLSGLNAEVFGHIEKRVVESAFGWRLSELKIEHDAWANAAAACEIAANEISREAEITPEGFRKLSEAA